MAVTPASDRHLALRVPPRRRDDLRSNAHPPCPADFPEPVRALFHLLPVGAALSAGTSNHPGGDIRRSGMPPAAEAVSGVRAPLRTLARSRKRARHHPRRYRRRTLAALIAIRRRIALKPRTRRTAAPGCPSLMAVPSTCQRSTTDPVR